MKKFLKITLYSLLGLLLIAAIFIGGFIYKVKYGFPIYESNPPELPTEMADFSVLLFTKTNGFRHGGAIKVSNLAFREMATKNGWTLFETDNGAVFNEELLAKFDVVIWSNVTGRVLKEGQQAAFRSYMENGGGFVGIHGAGDDSHRWEWYEKTLLGAKFSHHSLNPQFQEADMHLECDSTSVFNCQGLEAKWTRSDEWYVFYDNPRENGFTVLYTVDENTFDPSGNMGFLVKNKGFGMGDDHPIVWYKELPGGGRTFYSALGHAGRFFEEEKHLELLKRAILWAGDSSGNE